MRLSPRDYARLARHITNCSPWSPREARKHGHQLQPHLPLPESINHGVEEGVGEAQQPQVILQHLRQMAFLTCHVHYAHHKEGAPEDQDTDQEHCNGPQRLSLVPEAAPLLLLLPMLLLLLLLSMLLFRVLAFVLPCYPGSSKSVSDDLPLVGARDLQDVQVDVEDDAEHREEADDKGDHGKLMDNGEIGAEAVVGVGLQLAHRHWVLEGKSLRGTNMIIVFHC